MRATSAQSKYQEYIRCAGLYRGGARVRSKPEFTQRRVIIRPASERPMIFALSFLDRQIVDAREAQPHQAMRVEFPVLVAIAAEPEAAIIVPFVCEAYRNAVFGKRPALLDEAIIELARPLACQER